MKRLEDMSEGELEALAGVLTRKYSSAIADFARKTTNELADRKLRRLLREKARNNELLH